MPHYLKLVQCFQEALALPEGHDYDTLRYQSIPSWDSIGHMRLVAAIETTFDILFTTDQILDMSDFSKALEIVKEHELAA